MVWKELTRERLEETKNAFSHHGFRGQCTAMAMEIVLTALGPEWWKKNCSSKGNRQEGFFPKDISDEDRSYDYQNRILRLGDMLYDLRHCHGYHSFISALRTREFEAAFFELWAAHLFLRSGYKIELVDAKGVKGDDYDLLATIGSHRISVETKAKLSSSALNENSLRNTLNSARKQLPDKNPGIVFISIPNSWVCTQNAEEIIGNCVDGFFRSSARVNYVVLAWHEWIKLPVGRASALLFREYRNPNARFPVELGTVLSYIETPHELTQKGLDFRPSFW